MELKTGDQGPCQLLFVSRVNLAEVVQRVAPDLCLVPRDRFTAIAADMLGVVEDVVARKVKDSNPPGSAG